jgi:uncharacterized membrane protein YdbT with pleckstrin-like domain
MPEREFAPNSRYQIKMMVNITLIAILIILGVGLLAYLIGLDDRGAGSTLFTVGAILDALFWLIAMILSVPYFRSLNYEILQDEVIVHVGILTHSVKHVPYRTVTNITVKRDIFDRWFFNLGSLNIQTAGMSGQSGAEEKLVGMENIQEIYQIVVTELRRFRGGMTPTAALETEAGDASEILLSEVKAIRQLLEKKEP